jgi:hypothetical protein
MMKLKKLAKKKKGNLSFTFVDTSIVLCDLIWYHWLPVNSTASVDGSAVAAAAVRRAPSSATSTPAKVPAKAAGDNHLLVQYRQLINN